MTTGVVNTGDKFSTFALDTFSQPAASVVDTGGQHDGVVDTGV